MDYRHTEGFARQMEAAALQGHALRRQAVDAFWKAVFAALGRAAGKLAGSLVRTRPTN